MTTAHHLVIQAPGLDHNLAEHAAALASAQGAQRINATAVRLLDVEHDADTRQQIRDWCATRSLDFAFIPADRSLASCRILAMDMDSTLINIECIDEIAALSGRGDQVKAITEAAMRGEIKDFSNSLTRRVALLEGVPASILERVYAERLRLNAGAENLLAGARAAGLKTLLVSGGFTFFTERLQERLGLDETHANTLEIIDGKLTGRVLGDILDGAAKARHLLALATRLGAERHQVIAMGDGANDLLMMEQAAFSVAWRAKPVVRAQAAYALDHAGLDGVLNWFEGN